MYDIRNMFFLIRIHYLCHIKHISIRFKSIGAQKFKFPRQAVFTLDHDVQNKSEKVKKNTVLY